MRLDWVVPVCVAWALAGCAHTPPGDDGLSFQERRERLLALDVWEMRGRLAVDTGERAFQGTFHWRQAPDALALSIRGPLGAGILEVAGPPDRLTVKARGETWALADPETELSRLLGWWMPVGSLRAWLLGLPDPAYRARRELGSNGVLVSLEQRLWQLRYPSYQLAGGLLLPRRIDLSHDRLKLRLIVDAFSPPALN